MAAVFNEAYAGVSDFRCHICFTRFSKLSKLILHQNKHSDLRLFKCKFCPERFSKFSKLIKHQRRHAVHKPLQCEYCYKNFKKPSKLIEHQLKHNEKTCLHCHLCLKKFSSLQNYLHHIALDCSKTVCDKLEDRSLNISRTPNEVPIEIKSKIPAFDDANVKNIKKFDEANVENVISDFIQANLHSVNLSSSDTDCEIIDYVKEESHRRVSQQSSLYLQPAFHTNEDFTGLEENKSVCIKKKDKDMQLHNSKTKISHKRSGINSSSSIFPDNCAGNTLYEQHTALVNIRNDWVQSDLHSEELNDLEVRCNISESDRSAYVTTKNKLFSVNLSSSCTDSTTVQNIPNDSNGILSGYQLPQSDIHKASDSAKSISKDVCLENKSHVFPSTSTASDFVVVDLSSDSNSTDLDLMENSEHLKAGSEFMCKYCDIEFAASSDFMDHMKFHDIEEEQKCHFCLQTFSTSSALAEHLPEHLFSKSHENYNKEKPVVTLESTKEKPVVILESTSNVGKMEINILSFPEVDIRTLSQNITDETKEKESVQVNKNKDRAPSKQKVASKPKRKNQKKTKEYKCKTCNKSFTSKAYFKDHLNFHLFGNQIFCEVCHKTFTSKSNLKTHQIIHTGERPFVCKFCNKGFTQMGNLKTHIRIHTGDYPFSCKVCHRRFNQKKDVENHENTHNKC